MLFAKKIAVFISTEQTDFSISASTVFHSSSMIIGPGQQFYIAIPYLEISKTPFFDGKNITDFLD